MVRPFLLTRAGIGLAALGVEQAAALPGRAIREIAALPSLPIRLVGGAVQTYLHVGQAVTELAVRGDRVIGALLPAPSETPSWAHFDEDEEFVESLYAEDPAETDEDPLPGDDLLPDDVLPDRAPPAAAAPGSTSGRTGLAADGVPSMSVRVAPKGRGRV